MYNAKYLRAEPANAQEVADAQVEAIFRRKKEDAMADELSAMCRRNPNRQAAAAAMERVSGEVPAVQHDVPMLIVSGLMLIVTLAVSLARVLG